jgi:hypothetical protein
MKKIKYILFIVFMVSVSCENLLEEPVYHFRTDETAFATEESADAVLLGMYKSLGEYDYMGAQYMQSLSYNSAHTCRRRGGEADLAKMTQTSTNVWTTKVYAAIFSSVAKANIILSVTDSASVEPVVVNSRGQAYFFRAMNYFNLVRIYGSVPIVEVLPKSLEETNIPRAASVDVVYDFIIKDLMNAYENLDETQSSSIKPRKMAAYALLAKVYAQLASMCEDKEAFGMTTSTTATEYWTLARDYADSVILSGVYSLVPDYTTLFDLDNEFTQESIFEIGHAHGAEGAGNGFTHMMVPVGSGWSRNGTGGWGRIVVSREMYDTVLAINGGVDARLSTNLISEYTNTAGQKAVIYPLLRADGDVYFSYPTFQKYKDPDGANKAHANNLIYLRYADILLTYAEASNELEGPTPRTIEKLNEVLLRSRNSGNGSSIPAEVVLGQYTSKEEFRARIMTERLAELMGENHDWYDARRRGRAYFKAVCENHNKRLDEATAEGIFDSEGDFYFETSDFHLRRNLWWPIPLDEITANEAIQLSDQNFGY